MKKHGHFPETSHRGEILEIVGAMLVLAAVFVLMLTIVERAYPASPQAPLPPQAPPARTVAWAWTVAETKAGCDCACGKQCVCDNVCDCEGDKIVAKRCCTCLTEGTFCTCPSGECACGRWENHKGKLHESHRPGVRVHGVPVTFGVFHGGTPSAGTPAYSVPSFAPSMPSFGGGGWSSGGGGGC